MADVTRPNTGIVPIAEKVRTLAAERAEDADRSRRLAPEVIDAVHEAGFARHFVSAEHSGHEGTFRELTDAVITLGEGCAATAWCASLSAFSSRFATHLPPEGQQSRWGETPDTFIAVGMPPMGRAVAVDGGHRVTGRWNYVSGVDFAEWVLLCAVLPPADAGEPRMPFYALPRGSYDVAATWDNIGMRATSSHTVVVDDVFVPEHLSFDRADMITGRNQWSGVPTHNVPFQAVGGLTFVAPAAGAGAGALNACASAMAGKKNSVSATIDLVRASGQVDAPKVFVEQNAAVLDNRTFTADLMARNERNAAVAANLLVQAVGGMVRAAGTSGLAEGHPL